MTEADFATGIYTFEGERTSWIAANLKEVANLIHEPLTLITAEGAARSLSVDIVATGRDGRRVLVEVQRGPSDHKHLGQLLTYLTELDAMVGVWIAESFGTLHLATLHRINQMSNIVIHPLVWSLRPDGTPMMQAQYLGPSETSADSVERIMRIGDFWREFEDSAAVIDRAGLRPAGRGARLFAVDDTAWAVHIRVGRDGQLHIGASDHVGSWSPALVGHRADLLKALRRHLPEVQDPFDHWGKAVTADRTKWPMAIDHSHTCIRHFAQALRDVSKEAL